MSEKVEVRSIWGHPIVIVSIEESFEEDLKHLYELSLSPNELIDSEKIRDKHIREADGDVTLVYQRTSAFSKDTYVLNRPELKTIQRFCTESVNTYMQEIYGASNELLITQSWLNIFKPGHFHQPHYHPNSIISGIFYPYATENMAPIRFSMPNTRSPAHNTNLSFNFTKDTPFNTLGHEIVPKSGDLVLFPSPTLHNVPDNLSKETRMSISFNTWVTEPLGKVHGLTYCALQHNGLPGETWN
tara:strand:+ start:50 stop:778 length:729 start_codon:yes stop_codon:yes gene_type:complete